MLLRFKTSQASYVCRPCVLAEGDPDSLKGHQAAIAEILAKEEESIKKTASEPVGKEHGVQMIANSENNIMNDSSTQCETTEILPKKTVFRYYLRKECKHGVKWQRLK